MDNESIIGSVNDEALKRVLSNIEKAYGNLSDECGCYAGSCSRSRWLSVYNIVQLVVKADEEPEPLECESELCAYSNDDARHIIYKLDT